MENSSVYLAREFIITRIVESKLENGDVLDHAALINFTKYGLLMEDILVAVNGLANEGLVEKIGSDQEVALKMTEKGESVLIK